MVKFVDSREREVEILDLVVKSYINESKPISSSYLCEKYNLAYSSATVRNVMEVLEKKGFLSHIHTSSGRIPTQEGFKYYVEHLKEFDFIKNYPVTLDFYAHEISDIEEGINYTLEVLAEVSGYTSLIALSGKDERFFFRGARFILEQPEFEDIHQLRNVFYALEVKISQLQDLLFHYLDENVKILIGDEIGFEEISGCSLMVSGSRQKELSFALALLGPMRMNYVKAASCLYSIKNGLKKAIEGLV
jgi:transcriptional regulator of heat shock response